MRFDSYLEVSLKDFKDNFYYAKELAMGAELIPMLKANAYGHGLLELSEFVSSQQLSSRQGLASLGEAIYLLKNKKKNDCDIWIFSDLQLDQVHLEKYHQPNIHPVISNIEDLRFILGHKELCQKPLILKIETGMNRLGLDETNWEEVIDLLKKFNKTQIFHLMTHFSYSWSLYKPGDKTSRQIEQFKKAYKFFTQAGIEITETSLANSGALEQQIIGDANWARPGLLLYGAQSGKNSGSVLWRGKLISRLISKVLKVFFVKKGTPVGYGINVAPEDGWMALISLGYGDGFLTFYSGVSLKIHEQDFVVFGRVNMDMTYLFKTGNLPPKFKAGDKVDIWSRESSNFENLFNQSATTPYQLMCALSSRLPRRYLL